MSKRKRPESKSSAGGLNEEEKTILEFLKSRKGMGATSSELKENISPPTIIRRCILSLKKSQLIREVQNINNKGIKHYLAIEFDADKVLTGGEWYTNGALDVSKIEDLKMRCLMILERVKDKGVVTLDIIYKCFEKASLEKGQIKEILKNLVLDNLIMEVKSTGLGEFSATRIGEVCYKLTGKKSGNGETRVGAFASIPCGVCPHIGICSPDGMISPTTCSYFQKWLDF